MEPPDMLALLLELAAEAGIRVRTAHPTAGVESGVCRVKGELWLVLVPTDPLDHRIRIAAGALRAHAPSLLETRWLPPALRTLLEAL